MSVHQFQVGQVRLLAETPDGLKPSLELRFHDSGNDYERAIEALGGIGAFHVDKTLSWVTRRVTDGAATVQVTVFLPDVSRGEHPVATMLARRQQKAQAA